MFEDVPQLPAGLREGDVVAGKYRIEGVLGAGAMGTVVAAYHVLLAERVAIKFLHPHSVGNPDATARFVREAQAATRIKNEHVARVRDIAALDSGHLYIVMEHLEGCDLAAWARRRGLLPVEEAVDCILQACEAIAEAHALGIIHRDLKPANLFMVHRTGSAGELVKVLDFGISKTIRTVSGTIDPSDVKPTGAVTGASEIMGSPYYMSPEQMESARDVDGRTDIWALGVILCELVTGALPFHGNTILEVYRKVVSQSVPALPDSPARYPRAFEAVVLKCLERQRHNRYASVHDLAIALRPFASANSLASVERIKQIPRPAEHADTVDPARPLAEPVSTASGGRTLPSREYAVPPTHQDEVPPDPASSRASSRASRIGPIVGVAALALAALIVGRVSQHTASQAPGAQPPPPAAIALPAMSGVLAVTRGPAPLTASRDDVAVDAAPVQPSPVLDQPSRVQRKASTSATTNPMPRAAPSASATGTPASTSASTSAPPQAAPTASSPNDELLQLLRRRE